MNKLIFRNVSRSIKDYAIYFLTVCLAVSMFYAFNSISSQPAMGDLSKSMAIWGNGLTQYIKILSKLISVILAALVLYANRFIMKRRSKELAIYTTLGMPQRKIAGIFAGEILLIGAAALAAGIGIGFFLSQAMSALAVQLFVGNVGELILVFSFGAVKETVITFFIIYLLVALLSAQSIKRVKLIDMLKQERANQEITARNSVLSVSCLAASVIAQGFGCYLLLTKGISKDSLWFTMALLAAGIVLLFYSIGAALTTIAGKAKSFYFKGLNSFLVRQVSSRLRINMWVMVTLACLLILSVTILGVGFSVTGSFNRKVNGDKAVDFTVMQKLEKGSPEELLKAKGIDPAQYVKRSIFFKTYSSQIDYLQLVPEKEKNMSKMDRTILNGTVSLIAKSDYNALLSMIGEAPVELAENEYLINANYEGILPYYKAMLKTRKEIELSGRHLKNKGTALLTTEVLVGLNRINAGMLIVDDSLIKGLKTEACVWNAKTLSREAEENLYDAVNRTFLDMSLDNEIYYASRLVNNNTYIGIFGVIAFLCSYLGLILIVVTLAVLALQQLTEMQENRLRYLNLTRIGASKQMLQRTIYKQIGVYFAAPLVPAMILSVFVIKAVTNKLEPFFGIEIGMNLIVSVALLLAMYFIYYVVTCITAQSIIIEKRVRQ